MFALVEQLLIYKLYHGQDREQQHSLFDENVSYCLECSSLAVVLPFYYKTCSTICCSFYFFHLNFFHLIKKKKSLIHFLFTKGRLIEQGRLIESYECGIAIARACLSLEDATQVFGKVLNIRKSLGRYSFSQDLLLYVHYTVFQMV